MLYVTIWNLMHSQHCDNDKNANDDNVMCASTWFESLAFCFNFKSCDIWEGNM